MPSDEHLSNDNLENHEPVLEPLKPEESAAPAELPPLHRREIDTLYHNPDSLESSHSGEPVLIKLPVQTRPEPTEEELDADGVAQVVSKPRTPEQLEKAKYRQEVYFRMRRQKKKKRVFLHRIRKIAKLVFMVVMLVGFYFVSTASIWDYSLKRDGFELHGNHILQPAAFYPLLNDLDNEPIYRINPAKLKKTVLTEIPMVEDVFIRRHLFPTGMDITVVEKPVWGFLYHQPPQSGKSDVAPTVDETETKPDQPSAEPTAAKPTYLIHWDGTLTDLAQYPLTEEMQRKLDYTVNVVGQRPHLDKAHLIRYRDIAYVLNQNPTEAKLQYLDISNPFDIYGQFDGFRVRVGRADTNVVERLNRLFHIIPQSREQQSNIEYVDLRWDHQVTFRKKGAGSADTVSSEPTNPQ